MGHDVLSCPSCAAYVMEGASGTWNCNCGWSFDARPRKQVMPTQPTIPTPSIDRFVMPTEFLDELAHMLIEYEVVEGFPIILSIRLCKEVAKSGEVFYRPDGTCLYGPAYEAVWLYGVPGANDLLSPKQFDALLIYMSTNKSLPNIPEERIIHAQPYYSIGESK